MTYTWPKTITYADDSIRFNPDGPFELVYPGNIDTHFVDQVLPVPESMKALAAPLTLPDTVTVTFYREGEHDEKTRPHSFTVDLDPEKNEGYTRARLSNYYYEGRGLPIHVIAREGDARGADLFPCPNPKCKSPWARVEQQAYGNATDCPACRYHDFYDIGD